MRATRRASRPASALVVAVACSNTADGVTRLGVPLLVLAHGGSASTVAWVMASGVAPWLVLALPAGAALDRGRPDRWARFAHGARVALLVAATLAIGGPSPHPPVAAWMVLAWALGCAEVVADLAAQTLVPRTIDDHGLAGLNARVSAAQLSANQFVGPIVGGVAVATIGPGALAVAAAAYGFAALTIPAGSLPGTDQENPAAEPAKCTGLGDALHYLRARRDLASLAAAVGVLNAVNEATMAVLPALALGAPLRWSEQSLGTYIGLGGIGGLAGAAIAPATVRRWGPRATVAVTLPTIGATPIAIAAAPTTITVTTCLVLAGAATPCAAVAIVTHRQRTTPVHLLGRVNAAFQTLGIGAATIGAVAAANLQRALTHRQTIALIAIAGLTALAALRPARALPERPPRPQT